MSRLESFKKVPSGSLPTKVIPPHGAESMWKKYRKLFYNFMFCTITTLKYVCFYFERLHQSTIIYTREFFPFSFKEKVLINKNGLLTTIRDKKFKESMWSVRAIYGNTYIFVTNVYLLTYEADKK